MKYKFKPQTQTKSKIGVNAILWALKVHGSFEDRMHATTIMYDWIQERLPEEKQFRVKSSFDARLKELEQEGVLDRGVHGRNTKKVQLLKEDIEPPFENPFVDYPEPPRRTEEPAEKPERDTGHFGHFRAVSYMQGVEHLRETHDIVLPGPVNMVVLDKIHRDAHEIEEIVTGSQSPPSQVQVEYEEVGEEIEAIPEEAPDTVGKLLQIVHLATRVVMEQGEISTSLEELQDLKERLELESQRVEKWRRQYSEMKQQRDSLWQINKRLEANLSAVVKGNKVDDREFKQLQREMASVPGHDRSNGRVETERKGGVSHTTKSEGMD